MESSFYFQVTDSAQQRTNLLNFLLSSVADTQGIKGDEGNSAYEIALSIGFVGSEAEWMASLKGVKGDKGESYSPDAVGASTDKSLYDNQPAGFSFLDIDNSLLYIKRSNANGDWFYGILFGKGDDGDSAYTIAVANGFIGTQVQWLASLKGTKGDTGDSITDVTSNKVGKNTTVNVYVEGSLAESFIVSDGLDGAGAGDMLKSVYDTNGNGRVDRADIADFVEWSNIANKPTTANALNAANDYTVKNITASGSVTVGQGGSFVPGSIYSDPNWGIIFRAKQANPAIAEFVWMNSVGTELFSFASGKLTANITGSSASCTGNSDTATTLVGDPTNWATYRSQAVANMLGWKIHGNGHVIFDASAGTAPNGVAVNNTNPNTPWYPTHPTLMGWNGSQTYGVRVDSARVADSTTYASAFTTAVGSAPSYACRAWVNFNGIGTVAIRASGNVSSITDNGVGSFRVNFTTAMPDSNYGVSWVGSQHFGLANLAFHICTNSSNGESAPSTSYVDVIAISSAGVYADPKYCSCEIFR